MRFIGNFKKKLYEKLQKKNYIRNVFKKVFFEKKSSQKQVVQDIDKE